MDFVVYLVRWSKWDENGRHFCVTAVHYFVSNKVPPSGSPDVQEADIVFQISRYCKFVNILQWAVRVKVFLPWLVSECCFFYYTCKAVFPYAPVCQLYDIAVK